MQYDIDSEFCRTRVDWRSEGAVDDAYQSVLLRQGRSFLQVHNSQSRIGRGLKVEQLCIRTDGTRVLLVVRSVDKSSFDSEFWKPLA